MLRVGNSLFCSCHSCCSLQKERQERITPAALYIKGNKSELLPLLLTKRSTRANRSRHSFKRAKWADCSFHFFKHKCNSLFMWERFALLLFRSCCSLQQEWKENFSLFKRAKERFTLFSQKPLIGTKNQRKSQPWLCCNIVIFPFLRHWFQI